MNPVNLKKSHFCGSGIIILADGAVADGKWAMRASRVKNALVFTSPDTASAALGIPARAIEQTFESICPGGEVHEWAPTKFAYLYNGIVARVFKSAKTGEFAGIDKRILAVAGIDDDSTHLWGKDQRSPFIDAATREEASFIAMPFKIEPFPATEDK